MGKLVTMLTVLSIGLITNCLIWDAVGLTETYRGDEAKKKLIGAARVGDYLMADIAYQEDGYTGEELISRTLLDVIMASLINETVMSLNESRYYRKREVNECAKVLSYSGPIFDFDSFVIYSFNSTCSLRPDNEIIDSRPKKDSNGESKNDK
ncbi:TIGR04452 family lipoprotein [Leptospira andrefontaineae]|uniref:TIGR04452 family lipoprotein n=1 Tax=Leptospira andrefontaineae TaxID=2484976 RepID=A0A4R9H4I6_9LEPT|nr:TIGR04452 family lipoprotein [Leptospira andrefontaineae]TGK39798.1 TIGR04452 family lipoprotein [Leptospira andrefontaineae]